MELHGLLLFSVSNIINLLKKKKNEHTWNTISFPVFVAFNPLDTLF